MSKKMNVPDLSIQKMNELMQKKFNDDGFDIQSYIGANRKEIEKYKIDEDKHYNNIKK